jgi:adenylate cyclase
MISKYSIAVLPFVNMSSDAENEYFSDGITEEIINALAKIKGLHVTSRTSSFAFKDRKVNIQQIGEKLKVSLILEGSVRKSGDQVRITAQLINVIEDNHIWSDSWNRELKDIFILQDEIAGIIAEKVNSNVSIPEKRVNQEVKNPLALDHYLKGLYYMNMWDFQQADTIISHFEKAIELDDTFVKAYIGLSNAYTWLGSTGYVNPMESHKKIEFCIERIGLFDQENPEIYLLLSGKNYWIEWNIPEALKNINKAIELKPGYADAYTYKALILASLGNVEESLDAFFYAERLNPYADTTYFGIGMIYNMLGELDKAEEYLLKNIEICPHWYAQYLPLTEIYCNTNRFDEAWEIVSMLENDERSPLSTAELKGLIHAISGNTDEAHKELKNLEAELAEEPLKKNSSTDFFALIHMNLGEIEKAVEYIVEGIQNRAAPVLFLKIDTRWDKLKDNSRFVTALKAFEFPEFDHEKDKGSKKYARTNVDLDYAEEMKGKLHDKIVEHELYLNPALNLSDLAESVEITTAQLSQILNEYIGKNFYDFVNSYRLDYFLRLYKDPKNKQFTLLSLAYESGFNSKTTFNTFFKKTLGKSPSVYLKQLG